MKIGFSRSATRDIDRAATNLKIEAGDRVANAFLEAIENRIAMLCGFPESGTVIGRTSTRWYPVAGFPYLIFYRINRIDEIFIIRIRPAHRRPLTWL